jgi:hypothetical protein
MWYLIKTIMVVKHLINMSLSLSFSVLFLSLSMHTPGLLHRRVRASSVYSYVTVLKL